MSAVLTDKPTSVAESFRWAEAFSRQNTGSFQLAFRFLRRPQYRAMHVLYAWMRIADDISDEPPSGGSFLPALDLWRNELRRAFAGEGRHPLSPALTSIIRDYEIPEYCFTEVIDGVECDRGRVRIADFDELRRYCYRVASVVGIACVHIWGYQHPERFLPAAEAAGVAFQLTNILRDLAEDRDRDRIYLPADELERFGTPPEGWGVNQPGFREMMAFQAQRAREWYARGADLHPCLTRAGRAVFQTMTGMYRELLQKIVERDYDVFQGRVRVAKRRKIRQLLRSVPVRFGWRRGGN